MCSIEGVGLAARSLASRADLRGVAEIVLYIFAQQQFSIFESVPWVPTSFENIALGNLDI
jgi:hypothetical protein